MDPEAGRGRHLHADADALVSQAEDERGGGGGVRGGELELEAPAHQRHHHLTPPSFLEGERKEQQGGSRPKVHPAADATTTADQQSLSRLLGAAALVSGAQVGAGIIALPVKTCEVGFIPSTVAMLAAWLFMALTACLLVEAAGWFPGQNLVTMAEKTLGHWGAGCTSMLYLFVTYATLTAYVGGSEDIFSHIDTAVLGDGVEPALGLPGWTVALLFTSALAGVVYLGTGAVDSVNAGCLVAAMGAYAVLVAVAVPAVEPARLLWMRWAGTMDTLPVMVVAFTFHNMLPSLLTYLGSPGRTAVAILLGSGVPFALYLVWQVVVLGANEPAGSPLPGAAAVVAMLHRAAGARAMLAVQVFSFFAIVTSYLGVCMGATDFVRDLLTQDGSRLAKGFASIPPWAQRVVPLAVATCPPCFMAVAAPGVFYAALELSGTLRLVLFGMMPAAMCYRGRYSMGFKPWTPGGRWPLFLVVAVAVGVIAVEVNHKWTDAHWADTEAGIKHSHGFAPDDAVETAFGLGELDGEGGAEEGGGGLGGEGGADV